MVFSGMADLSIRRSLALLLAPGLLAACAESPTVPQLKPVANARISDTFGPRPVHPIKGPTPGGHHDGYDFAARTGEPIRAAMAGTVLSVGTQGGYGKTVVLKHPGGWTTLYGHAGAFKVKAGQAVKAGQIVGTVGQTGLATGPHLHYELRRNGVPVDPVGFYEPEAPAAKAAPLKLASAGKLRRPAAKAKPAPPAVPIAAKAYGQALAKRKLAAKPAPRRVPPPPKLEAARV